MINHAMNISGFLNQKLLCPWHKLGTKKLISMYFNRLFKSSSWLVFFFKGMADMAWIGCRLTTHLLSSFFHEYVNSFSFPFSLGESFHKHGKLIVGGHLSEDNAQI